MCLSRTRLFALVEYFASTLKLEGVSDEAFSCCGSRAVWLWPPRCRLRRRIFRAVDAVQGAGHVAQYNWTGFYLGINGGGAWGDSDWNGFAVSNSPSGGMIGGTAGYNWQGAGSPWVFGLEGDIDWTNIKDSSGLRRVSTARPRTTGSAPCAAASATPWIASCRTSPAASRSATSKPTAPASPASSDTNAGWTVGVGIEGVIAGNWTAKLEYLYADLGDTTCSAAACGAATNVDLSLNILRAGLNYRF